MKRALALALLVLVISATPADAMSERQARHSRRYQGKHSRIHHGHATTRRIAGRSGQVCRRSQMPMQITMNPTGHHTIIEARMVARVMWCFRGRRLTELNASASHWENVWTFWHWTGLSDNIVNRFPHRGYVRLKGVFQICIVPLPWCAYMRPWVSFGLYPGRAFPKMDFGS